jgi:hypothetical protein
MKRSTDRRAEFYYLTPQTIFLGCIEPDVIAYGLELGPKKIWQSVFEEINGLY